jgi:valyl-tRNA synthetase
MKLPKVYEPGEYEADIYALWEKSGAFKPKGQGMAYSMVVPPPNANGNLHIGHALTMALQDVAVRYHRLKGDRTLFVPGADHAGLETWVVYEKELTKQGKSRFDFSREELYSQIWEFVAANRENYQSQFRRLGASVDWGHFVFSLDDKIVARAYQTFKQMFDDGLIYRAEKLVNYCTYHGTGFSDIEVEYETEKSPLYYLQYGPFELATTRPETKFGDTAVAVHPDDKRYKKWVGETVTVEGVNGPFDVQVIADEMVDPEFGTGVVKITPAHSFDDWDVAQRHHLAARRVISSDGTMNEEAGRFAGMTVMEARKAVVQALEEKGLLLKTDKSYTTRIGHCYKCGTVIEPMLMEQWFVDMQPLAKPAIEALKEGKITFYPEAKRRQLIAYMEHLRDWNISRQIAWGIPIPAFQNVDNPSDWIFDERVTEETIEKDGKTYRRDPDVFDTWFSSSSWPYATLGFPDSQDFKDFYPLSLMETGFDILMPWVSRMLMMGLYVTGEIPFKSVYLHGLVLDPHGQKMSKSRGNVVSPMDTLGEYGSDALRMGLINGQTPGRNQPFGQGKVVGARNFANKLWNIARFIENALDGQAAEPAATPESIADHWILRQLRTAEQGISKDLDKYNFAEAYDTLYHFVWDDLADWYIEASKVLPNREVLAYVLESTLKLTHPFAPFVTETIWQTLNWQPDTLLITSQWPEIPRANATKAKQFQDVQTIVTEARYLVKALNAAKPHLCYIGDQPLLEDHAGLIAQLANLQGVIRTEDDGSGIRLTDTPYSCWLDIDQKSTEIYRAGLADKQQAAENLIAQLETRLANKSYLENAPKSIVDQTKTQLAAAEAQLCAVTQEQSRFQDR